MQGVLEHGHQLGLYRDVGFPTGEAGQILPEPYQKIHAQTGMPVAHLTWSAVWAGAAATAVERARTFIRSAARSANGQVPPGAAHLTRASLSLRALRGVIASTLARYERVLSDERVLESLDSLQTFTDPVDFAEDPSLSSLRR